jgi:hypothetical protein
MLTTLILSAATVLAQQEEPANPARMIWIHKLVIESNTLPDEDRLRLERCFEHHSYSQPELQERIRGTVNVRLSLYNKHCTTATGADRSSCPTR